MIKTKVVDTPTFLKLAKGAASANYNRQVNVDLISDILDPDGLHLPGFKMLHNDTEVRVEWLLKLKGSLAPLKAWLDASLKEWNALPFTEFDE